ncbi:putative F-box protein At1g20795 [Arabidopsis lyrata subsp. lyrata]|uniref:putative F-box protein At1g20795 n=1 Tax=Arabidopsis lyrata subsp. lyrata TaxID=81972 RepID=UPI000A29CCA7|nr:putative F-box protein At1g20795 [Arabidopsis lyrata subsp. lyrata]|eukprot:XP_020870740.1 putative F-box protein At1g20795 [Arabidopsis lyrata subsp. lyrata]
MESLPLPLLEKILFKLDPKSLAMMQCTRRSINSHISDDPYFKSKYLSGVGSGLLQISGFGSTTLFCNPFVNSRLFRNKAFLEIKSQILSFCSGLLLLFIDGLCVANPLTKRYRFLDHSKSMFLSRVDRRGNVSFYLRWHKMNRIGFAVDQIDRTTQAFKVVCMNDTDASNPDETMYQFEISTGDSCWRLSETTITCTASGLIKDKKPVYFDGSLHWLRKDGSILAFNPETEQARLIPIKFPPQLSSANLFAAAEKELALISATEELINVYALEDTLTDPKWVLVKQIPNGVLDKETMRCWNVGAYDGEFLVLWEMNNKEWYDGVVHGYDLRANNWGVIGSVPVWCDRNQVFYHFKPSFSSAIELNEKVDVETMVHGDDENKRISTLSKIMRLIDEISPYAKSRSKKKGKRLMTEEETKLKMMMDEPSSSKFLDVKRFCKKIKFLGMEKINKRRRSQVRRRSRC